MDSGWKRSVLSGHVLFSSLNEQDLNFVLGRLRDRRFYDGQIICSSSDPADCLMMIVQGGIRVGVSSSEGREVVLAELDVGQVFGVMTLIEGAIHRTGATAIGDTTVLCLGRPELLSLLRRNAELSLRMATLLCERLQGAIDLVEAVAFHDLPVRLARVLMAMAEAHGRSAEAGIRIDRRIGQRDLGTLAATSRESVNKLLAAWRHAGLIRMDHGHIVIAQPAVLRRIALAID